MKVALVCIAKDEDHYIDEWIVYHKLLGFDRIFVYQNDWRYEINDAMVQVEHIHGNSMQLHTYNHFCSTNTECDWAAFIDIDEFILLKKHNNIKEFILDHAREFSAIALNWVMFGSNNLTFEGEYGVLKRFTKCQRGVDKHVKIILKLLADNPHPFINNPHAANVPSVDTNGHIINDFRNYHPNGPNDVAQINHYYWKTDHEFNNKIQRGRPDKNRYTLVPESEAKTLDVWEHLPARLPWSNSWHNEIEDHTILDYIKDHEKIF